MKDAPKKQGMEEFVQDTVQLSNDAAMKDVQPRQGKEEPVRDMEQGYCSNEGCGNEAVQKGVVEDIWCKETTTR